MDPNSNDVDLGGNPLSPLSDDGVEQQEGSRDRSAKARIGELTSRWERTLQALNESNNRYNQLQSRFNDLESNISQPASQAPRSELETFSDDELYMTEADLMVPSEEEAGTPEARNARLRKLAGVRKELNRRQQDGLRSEFKSNLGSVEKRRELTQKRDQALASAINALGPDRSLFVNENGLLDSNAPGTRAFNDIIATLNNRYGEERVNEIPEIAMLAAFTGARYVKSQNSASKPEGSVSGAQRGQASIPASGEGARVELSAREKALKRGDLDGALAEHPVLKSMLADIGKFAGPR